MHHAPIATDPTSPRADLWPQLFSDVNGIALWISSKKILTRLYSVLHWFHKRLEVNIKNPRENRCFQIVIVFSFGSIDNSNKCTVLWKIAARLISVRTSVNNEMWVKLRPPQPGLGSLLCRLVRHPHSRSGGFRHANPSDIGLSDAWRRVTQTWRKAARKTNAIMVLVVLACGLLR
jgi:hypothetical protein